MKRNQITRNPLVAWAFLAVMSLTQTVHAQHQTKKTAGSKSNGAKHVLDTSAIERIIGIKGKSNHGEYKVTVPQNDLVIMVDSFKIIPAMGLGTWVAFTPTAKGAML